jgi:glycosyltransferase involved in cell wall biosynthesis
MKRILLVSPHYPPTFVGGVEFYTQRLAGYLRRRGHDLSVVCAERFLEEGDCFSHADAVEDGVRVFRLAVPASALLPGAADAGTDVQGFFTDLLQECRPEVVHLQSGYILGTSVLAACQRLDIPVVVTLHDYWFICPRITLLHPAGDRCTGPGMPAKCAWCLETASRRYRWIEAVIARDICVGLVDVAASFPRLVWPRWKQRVDRVMERRRQLLGRIRQAAALVSPSDFLRVEMIKAGVPADRIRVIRLGIEPTTCGQRRRETGTGSRFGYLGQIERHKGLHVLVRAMRQIEEPNVSLTVYGDPTRDPRYFKQVLSMAAGDLRIRFSGRYSPSELWSILEDLDAIVVPSVWYENSPLVIHEARRAGLPVVASNLGGMAELVNHEGDGLLADAGDSTSLAQQLRRLVQEPGLLDRLRGNVVPPPTIDDEVGALVDLYGEVSRER